MGVLCLQLCPIDRQDFEVHFIPAKVVSQVDTPTSQNLQVVAWW